MDEIIKRWIIGISLMVPALCVAKEKGPGIICDFRDFGLSRADTLVTLDCNELVVGNMSPLFYADMRGGFEIGFTVKFGTFLTEQAVICKESRGESKSGDLTIGYDPGCERMFAEVLSTDGNPLRIFAGPKVSDGRRYIVSLRSESDTRQISGYPDREMERYSVLDFVVVPEEKPADSIPDVCRSRLVYDGYALPYFPGRWIVGHGYPGGFPNSLQLRKGEVGNLYVKGTGLQHSPGNNPLFTDRFTADPACTVVGDRIYAFVGEDCASPGGWFSMPHWVAYSSDDMINWEYHGVVLKASDFPHANPYGAWAAQVVEKDGKFYFYVTLDDLRNGKHIISVAVGDNPLGPYKPVETPLITDDMTPDSHRPNADIDPTVFVDGDGSAWIAWGNGDCYMARLSQDMTRLDGEIRHIGLRNYSEGPWLFKRKDTYYLVYAADAPGVQPEQLAYSRSKSLDGEWEYGGLLTGPARYGFTIHPSVNEFRDKWYLFYHDGCYLQDGAPGGDCRRHVCVERLTFNPDGTINPIRLTHSGLSR